MAAPNVNGRLHLTGVHQKPPASLDHSVLIRFKEGVNEYIIKLKFSLVWETVWLQVIFEWDLSFLLKISESCLDREIEVFA